MYMLLKVNYYLDLFLLEGAQRGLEKCTFCSIALQSCSMLCSIATNGPARCTLCSIALQSLICSFQLCVVLCRALIGSQPSRRCATGRLSCADDRRFTCGLCSSAYGIRRCGLQDPWRRGVLEQLVSVGLASIMSVSMVVKSTSSKAAANSSSESLCA